MNADTMKWIMEVLKKGVYAELGITVLGILSLTAALLIRDIPYRVFFVMFGILCTIMGLILCLLSAIAYDKFNAQLRAVETEERKEKRKEEKRARKTKSHKPES
jgi:hypothetical protein